MIFNNGCKCGDCNFDDNDQKAIKSISFFQEPSGDHLCWFSQAAVGHPSHLSLLSIPFQVQNTDIGFISLEMFISDKRGFGHTSYSIYTNLQIRLFSNLPAEKTIFEEIFTAMDWKWCRDTAATGVGRIPQMLITRDSFCTLIIVFILSFYSHWIFLQYLLRRMSPCLMHCWYWAFLLSGRLVITIPPTWL